MTNVEKPVDLHCHSTCSDGTLTPKELVELAVSKGLGAIALTDHDSVNGIPEALAAARGTGLEVIPGIEFSTEYQGKDVHIVGLYYDYNDPLFQEKVKEFTDERERRNRKMCALMCADGIDIPYEKLTAAFPGAVITRANFARYLLDHNVVSSLKEAFENYVGDDCRYFIPREKISPEKAIAFTRQFHGFPVLAHPFQYNLGKEGLNVLVSRLTAAGLLGIEAYYNNHTPEMTQEIKDLADKYGLLLSGGSDFHGSNKPGLELGTGYGHLFVPGELLTKIKHRLHAVSDGTRIFFCDFDGTLASSDKTITPATRKALDDFAARGNVFVLSSGRSIYDVRGIAEKNGLRYSGMFLSGYNGAEIYSCDTGTTCFRRSLPLSVVKRLFEMAKEEHIYIQSYDHEYIVTEGITEETGYYTRYVKMPVRVAADVPASLSEEPCKCLALDLENPKTGRLDRFLHRINTALEGQVHAFFSNPYYLEIVPADADNGSALLWLARYLGVPARNTIAAGDAQNDIPMIRAAGLGIVMKNALADVPSMREIADIITEQDNDHDGLAPILNQL